jgi:hypothetical protein
MRRHAHQKGQPRTSWPSLTPGVDRELPEFKLDAHPHPDMVVPLLHRIAGGLWLAVVAGPKPLGTARRTEAEALDHLAPRRRRAARATARPVRRLAALIRSIRPPAFTGSVLRRPSERVYRAAFSVLLGVALGYGYGAMTVQAPQACAKAFTLADKVFVDYENVTTAVHMMSTRGQSEYEGHEADAIQLWDDIDAAKADYRDAKAECVGGAR